MTDTVDTREGGEKCVRCGVEGDDRRTLWMACFYAMGELKIPFEEQVLFSVDVPAGKELAELLNVHKEPTQIKLSDKTTINLDSGLVKTDAPLRPSSFFTLRVCKSCRASWMDTIRQWFNNVEGGEMPEGDACIPIRENGTIRYITEREWYRRRAEEAR